MDVDICQDSWKVRLIGRSSGESKLVGMVRCNDLKLELRLQLRQRLESS